MKFSELIEDSQSRTLLGAALTASVPAIFLGLQCFGAVCF